MKNDEVVKSISEIGIDVTETAIATGVGLAMAGPAGAIGGAFVGSLCAQTLKQLRDEFISRGLSKKEHKRVSMVLDQAQNLIAQKLEKGQKVREDDFFSQDGANTSSAEELLEATLIAAQREYEERKLPYLAKLYANIGFDASISRPIANYLIKLSSEITYRQIIIIQMLGFAQKISNSLEIRENRTEGTVHGLENVGIATEVFDLYRKGIIFSKYIILDVAAVNPRNLELGGYGALLYNLMECDKLSEGDETVAVMKFLAGKEHVSVIRNGDSF